MQPSKIILGTVQFGLKYGVNNTAGQVELAEVIKILDYARDQGMTKIDTAAAYGEAEQVLNRALTNSDDFKFISKVPPQVSKEHFLEEVRGSLARLGLEDLYGLYFHHFPDFEAQPHEFFEEVQKAKNLGLIQRVGYSLYYESQAEWLLSNDFDVDILQVPYSLFDKRFEPYFAEFKAKFNTEIHVRSVFLQGIYFRNPKALPEGLESFQKPLIALNEFADSLQCSAGDIALGVPLMNNKIDGVVIGVDNQEQLKRNMEIFKILQPSLLDYPFYEIDPLYLNPSNWKT